MIRYMIGYFKTKRENKARELYKELRVDRIMSFEDFLIFYNAL